MDTSSLALMLIVGLLIGAIVEAFRSRTFRGAIYGGGVGLIAGLFIWAVMQVV